LHSLNYLSDLHPYKSSYSIWVSCWDSSVKSLSDICVYCKYSFFTCWQFLNLICCSWLQLFKSSDSNDGIYYNCMLWIFVYFNDNYLSLVQFYSLIYLSYGHEFKFKLTRLGRFLHNLYNYWSGILVLLKLTSVN
jgi:hypothetical protein